MGKAKPMIEEIGMFFKKHTLWGKEMSIVGIGGGFHEKVKMEDVNDDDDEIIIIQTQQHHRALFVSVEMIWCSAPY